MLKETGKCLRLGSQLPLARNNHTSWRLEIDAYLCQGRAAFGPGLRGLLRHFCNSNTGVVLWRAFIAHILTCIAPGGRGISNSFLAAQKLVCNGGYGGLM